MGVAHRGRDGKAGGGEEGGGEEFGACGVEALDFAGVPTTSLLAVLGTAGLAIGLAMKDSLSNIASGVMLIMLRPFRTGDFVRWREDGRIALRNVRRDARKALETAEKDGSISKDELNRAEKDLEKLTHDHGESLDKALARKEQELLEI